MFSLQRFKLDGYFSPCFIGDCLVDLPEGALVDLPDDFEISIDNFVFVLISFVFVEGEGLSGRHVVFIERHASATVLAEVGI